MNIDNCDSCGAYVNSDDDPECYVTISKTMTVCLCPTCRDERDQEDAEPEKDEPRSISVGEAAAEYAWRKSL